MTNATAKYRADLPQLGGDLFLTDGGLETVLIFQKGIELAEFAAIDLMRRPDGLEIVSDYFAPYIEIAERAQTGLILETLTWRASPDWSPKIGFESLDAMASAIARSVAFYATLRARHETALRPFVISGCVGPRGDGYNPAGAMGFREAADYHGWLVAVLAATAADCISALTMTNADEAAGIALAAKRHAMPVTVSFTVETDGRLPTGQTLADAIRQVDAATGAAPAYYMINCAHPDHFADVLGAGGAWTERLRGIRANASKCSHAELDNAEVLDEGNPSELGRDMAALCRLLPHINVLGGCCGTDHRHIAQIASACVPRSAAA